MVEDLHLLVVCVSPWSCGVGCEQSLRVNYGVVVMAKIYPYMYLRLIGKYAHTKGLECVGS